jgi:hypothetical protein
MSEAVKSGPARRQRHGLKTARRQQENGLVELGSEAMEGELNLFERRSRTILREPLYELYSEPNRTQASAWRIIPRGNSSTAQFRHIAFIPDRKDRERLPGSSSESVWHNNGCKMILIETNPSQKIRGLPCQRRLPRGTVIGGQL